MSQTHESEIHFPLLLEIENTQNRNGITISAVDDGRGGIEYYIFYKRPKFVTKRSGLFGLKKKEVMDNDYLTDITDQTQEDAVRCLTALINNDLQYLERKII